MVGSDAARRSQAVPDGAECDHQGGAGLVRRAGLCRGRDRDSPGLAGQRDASARARAPKSSAATAAARRATCGPRRNSPPRNCSPPARPGSSSLRACSATASAATCICPNSPCWNGIAPNASYDAVMADSVVVIAACGAGDRDRAVLVSRQDGRSVRRAGTVDGGCRHSSASRGSICWPRSGMARATARRLRRRQRARVRHHR